MKKIIQNVILHLKNEKKKYKCTMQKSIIFCSCGEVIQNVVLELEKSKEKKYSKKH